MTELLVIAGERLQGSIGQMDLHPTFADTVDYGAELLHAGHFDAALVDLRDGLGIEQVLDALGNSNSVLLPIVVVIEDGDVETSVVADKRNVGWVTEKWLAAGGGELLTACLDHVTKTAGNLMTLKAYEDRHEQLVHAEKFAAVGLLAAEVAHEINNPATFVITNLSVMKEYVNTIDAFHDALRERLSAGELDADTFERLEAEYEIRFLEEDLDPLLDRSLAGLNRIHQIVQDLRYFSRERTMETGPLRVAGLIEASVNLVRHEARYRTEIELDLAVDPPLMTDANRLSQVILNVLLNAVQAIAPGSPSENVVRVSTSLRDEMLAISISDTGAGMSDEVAARVFEPFFTTREPGEGTGLGLSISSDIMRTLGGEIELESTIGEGTTFTLLIPTAGGSDAEE